MATDPNLNLVRNDTDPVLEYEVTEDDNPVDLSGSTVVFTMASKATMPAEHVGDGDGVKATGTIQILDIAFDVGDSITLGSSEFVADDGAGSGWGVGVGSIEAARDSLYSIIVASGEPITPSKVSTDSILITYNSWDSDDGNAYVFDSTDDPTTTNFALSPTSGTLDGGETPEDMTVAFNEYTELVDMLDEGDLIRIEHPAFDERLAVKSVDYQTGTVVLTRGAENTIPAPYYSAYAVVWFLKIDRENATVTGNDNNILKYEWTSSDTNIAGTFYGEFEVTKPSGKIQTYPTSNQLVINIREDVDNK